MFYSISISNIVNTENFDRSIPVAEDLLEPITEACCIYALSVSCITTPSNSGIIVHVVETIYLVVIFFLRSIPILYTQISSEKDHKTQQFARMVLSALIIWIDCGLVTLIMSTFRILNPDNKLLGYRIAVCGLLQTYVIFSRMYLLTRQTLIHRLLNRYPFVRMVLPRSYRFIVNNSIIYRDNHFVLPRRMLKVDIFGLRHLASGYDILNPPEIQALIDQSRLRSIRILASYTELEREARDRATMRVHNPLEKGGRWADFTANHEYSMSLKHNRAFSKARSSMFKMPISEFMKMSTSEFLRMPISEFRLRSANEWRFYRFKCDCRWRSKWGQFFLCNFDWDWDLAGSLARLYAFDETFPTPQAQTKHLEAHIATTSTDGAGGHTWNLEIRTTELRTNLPKEVRIPYASESGDIEYMVFARDAEMPRVSPERLTTLSGHDGDSGDRESIASTGGSVSSDTQVFVGEIAGEGVAGTSALETSSESGSSLDFQECDSGSWSTQDIDGRPVVLCVDEELAVEAFIEDVTDEKEDDSTTFEMSVNLTQVCLQTLAHNK